MMKKFLTTTLTILSMATIASAQTETAGKFNLTANVGYVYNFANDWGGGDVVGKANGGLGYGGRIGWTNNSGFGVSADYLGFASKWKNDFEVTNNYHVVTFTPSYRISFGATKEWGLKLGLGVGFSLADVSWIGNKATATSVSGSRVAGGASYYSNAVLNSVKTGCGSSAGDRRYYSDSKGGFIGAVSLGANQCETGTLTVTAVAGLTDAEIAALFTVDTGAAKGSLRVGGTSLTDSVSYAVWRRLFTNAPGSGAFFIYDVDSGSYFNSFEARATYVTRVSETAAAAAETDYTTAAAAACVTSKGAGAIVVNGVCRTVAEKTEIENEECEAMGNGSTYSNGVCTTPVVASKAKDDAGFVLAPEIALEYDNGLFHANINARYIHELFHVKYDGQNGAADQLQKSGPLAVFIGAGLGVNF